MSFCCARSNSASSSGDWPGMNIRKSAPSFAFLIKNAKDGALFLMFMPGQSPLLEALLDRAQQNDIYVRGVVSTMMASKNGDIVSVGGEVVKSGAPKRSFHDDVQLPHGVDARNEPSWADVEF